MGKLWEGKIHGEMNEIRVTVCVQIHLSAAFPSPWIRDIPLVRERSGDSFTKGSLCLDFRQKTGEQRIPPVSAVS